VRTILPLDFRYPYEEFSDHIKAMRTVRQWEYTSRFGTLGTAQTSRANSARVVEYFSDTYVEPREAVCKVELFLSIYDYLGRHAAMFVRKGLMENVEGSLFSVEPCLLRAVHHVFTTVPIPERVDPKKVLTLANAFQQFE